MTCTTTQYLTQIHAGKFFAAIADTPDHPVKALLADELVSFTNEDGWALTQKGIDALDVEHITLAPLNESEQIYWSSLADEVCGKCYDALVHGPDHEDPIY